MTTDAFQLALTQRAAEIEVTLDFILPSLAGVNPGSGEARVLEAMRYAALGSGKRIRPFLVLETAAMLGPEKGHSGSMELANLAGTAVELIHCYSLVHDDLPAMDDDDVRRGKPTVHKAYDEATAILAGDALLTLAFEILATVEPDSAVKNYQHLQLHLIRELAQAAGKSGMVLGQMLDLAAEGRFDPEGKAVAASSRVARQMDADAIRRLQQKKTGALIACAVRMGALIGGASTDQLGALTEYAQHLGFAFQIADDIIDAEGDAVLAGKATSKDAALGKATLISLQGMDWAKSELAKTVNLALACLEPFGERAELLRETVRFMQSRKF